MLAIKSLLRPTQVFAKNAVQARNMSGIAIPARNKITRAETLILAGSMVVAWLTIPVWVLVNIKHYRDKN